MGEFTRYTGYIYPLPQMTDAERYEYLRKIHEEAAYDKDEDKFVTEQLGDNEYLLWITLSSYGKESGKFGFCRPCTPKELEVYAPKFREILGEIDNAKLKFIDYCYYNSTECTVDYYLSEPEVSETDAISAVIQHCKTQAPRNCGVMYEQYTAVAEWLTELQGFKDEKPINTMWLQANGFNESGFVKIGDSLIRCYATGRNRYFASVDNDERNFHEQFGRIKTIGQFKMFLTLCGVQDFVKQLKA